MAVPRSEDLAQHGGYLDTSITISGQLALRFTPVVFSAQCHQVIKVMDVLAGRHRLALEPPAQPVDALPLLTSAAHGGPDTVRARK